MLVLSRKVGEKIMIGDSITIVVQRVTKGRVAIAIQAPHSVPVLRGELAPFGVEGDAGEQPAAPASDANQAAPRPSAADSRRREPRAPLSDSHAPTPHPALRSSSVMATR